MDIAKPDKCATWNECKCNECNIKKVQNESSKT